MKKYILAHPWVLAISILFGALTQGLMVYVEFLTRDIVDALVVGDSAEFFSYISVVVVVIIFVAFFLTICARLFFMYSAKSYRTIANDFFDKVQKIKISEFSKESSAKYISILNNDVKNISMRYFSAVPQFSKDFCAVVLAIVAMIIISPLNAVIAVATAGLPLIAPFVLAKRLSSTQLDLSTKSIYFNQKVKDYFTGFEVIQTFGAENRIKSRFFRLTTNVMKAMYRSGAAVTDVGTITMVIMFSVMFLNYFVAGHFVLRGDMTIGGVVAIISLSSSILAPMSGVASHLGSMQSTKEISKRVFDIMEQEDTRQRDAKIGAFEGPIQFSSVSFAYENEDNDKKTALKNINYTFKKGGKYAIVGASGSGKSTIAKLIMGYYDDYNGDVLINRSNVRDINREGLYKTVSMLHQNVFLLDDTLRNNITLYSNYSDEEYRTALQRASLLNVVEALPNGSDTVLGEGGNTLSGGERQRVSIARALLKGSEVLVLDEATASLDNIVASEIEKSVLEMDSLTCIFVTHKYSKDTLEKCDGILVMKDGELFEQGTFDELYEKKCYFYSLCNVSS
ncbi:MAG: ABC transporter ATP-binding protein/permease [Defluviitaleaceae bacterium]|nr:ABC transporter ATP-binding protein/permease [Defluviitaleaceae bacterium]